MTTSAPSQVDLQGGLGAGFHPVPGGIATPARWHVLWTWSNCERLVHDQIRMKGYQSFLPTIEVWSRRAGRRHLIRVPLFPGYVFLERPLDRASYLDVLKVRGLARVLGERWDRPDEVPAEEVEAIRRVVASNVPTQRHTFLRHGQRVRIVRGPLANLEGIFVRSKPVKGLLVISVELLQRSVAVEVDCTDVVHA
jgi:transcription antitermination factor NusG